MDREEIIRWLGEEDPSQLETLWQLADAARMRHVGEAVHLRGLIEFSNQCSQDCTYCGLHVGNKNLTRYRMSEDEILACVHSAAEFGCGTVVLQSGQNPAMPAKWMESLIGRIKRETSLAVTLSVGLRRERDFALWRQAGADRYLLRFETSNPRLFETICPLLSGGLSRRMSALDVLGALGYEVGSGVMVGLPGQSLGDLADDIECFRRLGLDMVGVGPYIPHPGTSLGADEARRRESQPIDTELMTCKVVALTRLLCPRTNIPSTTALATVNPAEGWELGLARGANVIMPNMTPEKYRIHYEIYPAKACIHQPGKHCLDNENLQGLLESIGRKTGTGRGDSLNYLAAATPNK